MCVGEAEPQKTWDRVGEETSRRIYFFVVVLYGCRGTLLGRRIGEKEEKETRMGLDEEGLEYIRRRRSRVHQTKKV